MAKKRIKITKNGPYLVEGNIPLDKQKIVADEEGFSRCWQKSGEYPHGDEYSLCRCGKTLKPPFCDDTCRKIKFNGKETANRLKFRDRAERIEGANLLLLDRTDLCAHARFCDRAGGIWQRVLESDTESRKISIQEAADCPSGRLVVCDKESNKDIEPNFEPAISLVEDPEANVSGPIWVKGGIAIESDSGQIYESRNRVTLCRCGESKNKPYCDGTHIATEFKE